MSTTGAKYFIILVINVALSSCDPSFLGPKDLSLTNLANDLNPIHEFFASNKDMPTLIEDIAQLEKDGGLENYKLGLGNEDKDLNITQIIKKYGYKVEEYTVKTSDGYILTIFRIPGNGPPVLLMHGLLNRADDYITIGPNKALPYLLSNAGYDVWLGNARGSNYCRKHEYLSPEKDKERFFNFSWHEIGYYDLPAMIDYILEKTGEVSLNYIGHSQGTTAFFVMCSEHPEYNKKIKLMVALSAVVYMSHLDSPLIRLVSPVSSIFDIVTQAIGFDEFKSDNPLIQLLIKTVCGNTALANLICSNIIFVIQGFDYSQLNVTNAPVIFGHTPSDISMKQLYHYGQGINTGTFSQYDHGVSKNQEIYGTKEPPRYKLENVDAPVAIFYSKDNDWFSAFQDVKKIANEIQNVVEFYEVPWKRFCHSDYLYAKDVDRLVYKKVLELLEKYNK